MKWQEFKAKAKIRFQKFMYGRNGVDQLTVFTLLVGLIITILASVFRVSWLRIFYHLSVLVALYRMFSRNLNKRRLENQLFLRKLRRWTSWFRIQRKIVDERKTHKHFQCPNCKQRLRVPRGRGKITISCSKCGEKFSRKS